MRFRSWVTLERRSDRSGVPVAGAAGERHACDHRRNRLRQEDQWVLRGRVLRLKLLAGLITALTRFSDRS